MTQRGRKSEAALSAVSTLPERPEAPEELNPEEIIIWDRMTEAKPVDWFKPEHWDLLADYCHHTYRHRRLTKQLNLIEDVTSKEYIDITKLAISESQASNRCARAMRCTPQSQYDAKKGNGHSSTTSKKPWEKTSDG